MWDNIVEKNFILCLEQTLDKVNILTFSSENPDVSTIFMGMRYWLMADRWVINGIYTTKEKYEGNRGPAKPAWVVRVYGGRKWTVTFYYKCFFPVWVCG